MDYKNNTINYDFTGLEDAMYSFKKRQSSSSLAEIKTELNKFFSDSTCKEVIYTRNTDKPFFGMCVIPYVTGSIAEKILTDNRKERISEYYVEIDSKLLDLNLTDRELVAVLLHEVGHLVNDYSPVEEVKHSIDFYLHANDQHLDLKKSNEYKDLLAFGIKQALVNLTSLFKKDDEEIIADQFSVGCGFGPDLESAYNKIIKHTKTLNRGVPKLIALQWTLRIYKDLKFKRIGAIKALNKSAQFSGSVLQKREILNVKRDIEMVKDNQSIEEGFKFTDYIKDVYNKFKYKGIRALEDDMYELSLRVKNVDDMDEALAIIRTINTNMAVIDDYVNTEKDRLSEGDRKKCFDLLYKYGMLRDEVSKKTAYDEKYYGLFVKTPVIKSRYEI